MNINKKQLILGLTGIVLLVFSGIRFSKTLPVLHNKMRINKIINSQGEFDYKGYAKSLAIQVPSQIPKNLTSEQQKFVYDNVYKYSLYSGKKFAENKKFLNSERAYLTQIVTEWVFHKSVDLSRSEIPEQHKDKILQTIVDDTINKLLETRAVNVDIPIELIMIEGKVKESYKKSIDELIKNNLVDKDKGEKAKKLSNYEDLIKDSYVKIPHEENKK